MRAVENGDIAVIISGGNRNSACARYLYLTVAGDIAEIKFVIIHV